LNSILLDLSSRFKLRVTGTDRERFLNGQLSNDVRKATETCTIESCILNAKGKLNACVSVTVEGESYFLDADPDLRETLPLRLDRYIIADDVQLTDESDSWGLFHVFGGTLTMPKEFKLRSAMRFAEPGYDLWVDVSGRDELLRKLSPQSTFYDADRAELLRIEMGIPRWGRELTDEIIPIEANLEKRTIDYEKGCYIGQEVISRMKMSGQVNKRLCGLVSRNTPALRPGMRLLPISDKTKDVGWISSAAWSERLGKQIALGVVKRGFNSVATQLRAIAADNPADETPVEIVDLPFN
jgi:tRNA-modifying protein YgfZ